MRGGSCSSPSNWPSSRIWRPPRGSWGGGRQKAARWNGRSNERPFCCLGRGPTPRHPARGSPRPACLTRIHPLWLNLALQSYTSLSGTPAARNPSVAARCRQNHFSARRRIHCERLRSHYFLLLLSFRRYSAKTRSPRPAVRPSRFRHKRKSQVRRTLEHSSTTVNPRIRGRVCNTGWWGRFAGDACWQSRA